jgi:hypothetical protein
MITGEIKSKVDRIWDTLWSGGISNAIAISSNDSERSMGMPAEVSS